jgi:hypothetical protein
VKRCNQAFDIGFGRAEDMKREPLRRLLPDAREAFEFVNEFGDGLGVVKHFRSLFFVLCAGVLCFVLCALYFVKTRVNR